jgi:sRNA-binding regulator protein Hfq
MGWEQLWENISNIGNLSLVIIAVAALLYYFGKLIGDVKVEKYEKTDYYIEGLIFSLLYIAFPFVIVLSIAQSLNLYFPFLPSLILQFIILWCLWSSAFAHEYLKKHGALSKFKKLFREKIEKLKRKYKLVTTMEEKIKGSTGKDLTYLGTFTFYYVPIRVLGNRGTLFFFSFLTLWGSYSCISPETILLPSTMFLSILTFLNMTFLALDFGYANAQYPHAKIVLENGSEINGKILKFGEFVYLLKEDEEKKLFINKDKIVYVEESFYKEKMEDDEQSEV